MTVWNQNAGWFGARTAVITAAVKGIGGISADWVIEKQAHRTIATQAKKYCASCGTVFWKKPAGKKSQTAS